LLILYCIYLIISFIDEGIVQMNTKTLEKQRFKAIAIILLILLATFAAFYPSLDNQFTNFDDDLYVTKNGDIRELSSSSLKNLFTNSYVGHYQPLTMVSYALEYHFFKKDPFIYHLDNLVLHLLNALLVFWLFYLLSAKLHISVFVTLLFCLHPQHVESVAWISSRKDVLYTFFFLGALIGYFYYLKRNFSMKFYVFSMFLFICSLLSKGQAVVLPFVFLLIDYLFQRKFSYRLLLDKVVFIILSVSFGLGAIYFQSSSSALQDFGYFSFIERLLFPCYALVMYLYKMIIPLDLSCFYAYPETNDKINTVWVYLAPVLLLIGAYVVFLSVKRTKVILFGTLFFLLTIFPVLQFVPVGDAIMADRYTYLPFLGLFFILAMGYYQIVTSEKKSVKRIAPLVRVSFIGYLAVLWFLTWQRAQVWKDSITLFSDAISVDANIPITYANRGVAYFDQEMYELAIADFSKVIELKPDYPNAYRNRAMAHQRVKQFDNAVADLTIAISYNPNEKKNYMNRAALNRALKNREDAIADYDVVLIIDSNDVNTLYLRGELHGRSGNFKQALHDLDKAILLNPSFWQAYNNRGIIYTYIRDYKDAAADFTMANELNPEDGSILLN